VRLHRARLEVGRVGVDLPQGPLVFMVALAAVILLELALLGLVVGAAIRHEAVTLGGG